MDEKSRKLEDQDTGASPLPVLWSGGGGGLVGAMLLYVVTARWTLQGSWKQKILWPDPNGRNASSPGRTPALGFDVQEGAGDD